MKIGAHETHPAADAFPLMDDEALRGLADDIKANGLRCPIILIADDPDSERILDGRNRYLACLLAKVEPLFEYYDGPHDPLELARFVCSHNLARRDMNLLERAACARRLGRLIRVRKAREKVQPRLFGTEADHAVEVRMGDCSQELNEAFGAGELTLRDAVELSQFGHDEQRLALTEARKAEQERRPKKVESMRSVSVELSAADMAALRALLHAGEASVHGVVRAGAALLRKMVGGV